MSPSNRINTEIPKIILKAYTENSLQIRAFSFEAEGKEYKSCQFDLNQKKCIYREAKTTPEKFGQFVTFWKRNKKKIPEPFHTNDPIDFYLVTTKSENKFGQFIFPRTILLEKNIISTDKKEGKRGFRIYPIWDTPENKQAKKTQQWQLNYFFEFNSKVNLKELF